MTDQHVITGKIYFSQKGKIYIYLVDKKISVIPFKRLKTIIANPQESDYEKGFIEYQLKKI